MPDAATTPYLSARRELESRFAGTSLPWLNALRDQALDHFSAHGFPTLKDEDWKYTDLRPLTREPFAPASPDNAAAVDAGIVAGFAVAGLATERLVFVNGYHRPDLSGRIDGAGLTAAGLAETLESVPDRLEGLLGSLAPFEPRGFNALNTAFLTDGAFLEAGADSDASPTVELLFVSAPGDRRLAGQPRNLIVARPGSRLRILERHVSVGDSRHLSNVVTEIEIEDGAEVEHLLVHEAGDQAYRICGAYVRQARGSRYTVHAVSLGGRLVRNNIHVTQHSDDAVSILNGLYVGRGRQHVDNHTRIVHEKPGGVSREHFKGILAERSRAVFHGRIIVRPGAQRTDSDQRNENLLLSRDAEVDTKPQLEIYADDVKCSHGATVGQLDADAVFYLRSRGIDESAARGLLTFAFASEILGKLPLEPLREHLEGRIAGTIELPAPGQRED